MDIFELDLLIYLFIYLLIYLFILLGYLLTSKVIKRSKIHGRRLMQAGEGTIRAGQDFRFSLIL